MTLINQDIQTTKPTTDTTSQRIVFFIFCQRSFFENIFNATHKRHIEFCRLAKPNAQAKLKEPLFFYAPIIFILLNSILTKYGGQ